MTTVLLVVQVLLALGLIGIVLIQRSDSDGFGMGSGSGMGVLSGRAKANLLTRTTAILAALFMINSMLLTIVTTSGNSSVLDKLPETPAAVEKTITSEEGGDTPVSTETPAEPAAETPAATDAAPAKEAPASEDAPAPVVPRAE